MTFRLRNTRHPIFRLRDDMDRFWGGMLNPWAEGASGSRRGHPAANIWEQDDALLVELEVPGVHGDQIDISVVGDELTLKIERPELDQEGVTYHRRERPAGSFARVLRLPVEVDADRVEAELKDGVLSITLPKAESAKPRKIQVTAAS